MLSFVSQPCLFTLASCIWLDCVVLSQPIQLYENTTADVPQPRVEIAQPSPVVSATRRGDRDFYYQQLASRAVPAPKPTDSMLGVSIPPIHAMQTASSLVSSVSSATPTNITILVNAGPLGLSIANLTIMAINALVLVSIIVFAAYIYKRHTPNNRKDLRIDTSARLNAYQSSGNFDCNTFEMKDGNSFLHAIQEDTNRLPNSERSSSPATPTSFRFPLRSHHTQQAPADLSIHPIPKKKLSLSSLSGMSSFAY
ncbi:hypothetical protein BC835DRAFT_1414180 [Cytidiella melzeri]|nr:hypothetical protein BC835DRAFT_1414180 [Cytidiella melzeri]